MFYKEYKEWSTKRGWLRNGMIGSERVSGECAEKIGKRKTSENAERITDGKGIE